MMAALPRLSFHSRILLAFVGLTAFTLLSTAIAMYLAASHTGLGLAEQHLRVANRVVNYALEFQDHDLKYETGVAASDYGFREAVMSGDHATIQSALENQRNRIHADLFALMDENGVLTANTASRLGPLTSLTLQQAFTRARYHNTKPLIIELPDGRLLQIATVRVKAPETVGWVCAGIALDDEFLAQIKATAGSDLSVISQGDESEPPLLVASTLPAADRAALAQIVARSPSVGNEVRQLHINQDTYLTVMAAADQSAGNFAVWSHMTMTTVAAPVVALRRDMLVFGLGIIALCLVAALAGARMLAQPVRALAHAARSLSTSRRRGNSGRGSDELAQVARAFHALAQRAHYDGLTGLPNRTLLNQLLGESIDRMRGGFQSLAVVFIDLNGFKAINDTLGHEMGDLVLRKTGQRLVRSVTAPHVVARLGGDEFVLVLENMSESEATRTVEALATVVAKPMASPDGPIKVGMSAGIAMYPAMAKEREQLLQMADAAMYQSKLRKAGPVVAQPVAAAAAALKVVASDAQEAVPAEEYVAGETTLSEVWAGRDLATQNTRAMSQLIAAVRSMKVAPIPEDETQRLVSLRRLKFLDRPARPSFDRITRMAAKMLNTPIALISLVDEHRQWFMSRVGIDAVETHRDISFCAHAVYSREPLVVPDATADDRFSGNPAVTDEMNIRAYAGIPIFSSDGRALGTLCVCDTRTRRFSDAEITALKDLAHLLQELVRLREFTLDNRRRRLEEKVQA